MIKTLCLLLFLFSIPATTPPRKPTARRQAPPPPAVIRKVVIQDQNLNLTFPLVSLPDAAAAKKINARLQHDVLQLPAPLTTVSHLFDSVRYTSENGGIDELEYTVPVNSDRLLSLVFEGEFMGAYPNSFEQYFQFDPHTGALIRIEDLTTPEGLKLLGSDLRRRRAARIATHLEKLKKDPEARQELRMIRETLHTANQDADSNFFSIRPQGFHFHKAHALPHAIEELDADWDIDYPFQRFSP